MLQAVASGQKLETYGIENVIISTRNSPKNISNVVYVPGLKTNLLLVSTMIKTQHVIVFNSEDCQVYDENECSKREAIFPVSNHNALYRLDTQKINLRKDVDRFCSIKEVGNLIGLI